MKNYWTREEVVGMTPEAFQTLTKEQQRLYMAIKHQYAMDDISQRGN